MTISVNWTFEEKDILQEGLVKYASESSLNRSIKIAARLKDKTARDVALLCRWMTLKKEASKRKKEEINQNRRSPKDRKTSRAR